MKNIATKSDGSSSVDASELNSGWGEEKNAVTDSGQTLSEGDSFQLSKAMSINAAGADYYDDSGVADAYVLTKPGSVSLRSPESYFEGMHIRFRPANANTGLPATVNVAAIGVKSILKSDGVTALSAGDLLTTQDAEARFDITADAFLLKAPAPNATETSKGVVYLGDQRITMANNSSLPNNDIDFSGGRFTFDDGTGETLVIALTKKLDGNWLLPGNNQGALDVGSKAINSIYYCFAIYNPTNGNSDYLFSLSSSSPTLPGGYTKKRYLGRISTNASNNIRRFKQYEKTFIWGQRILELEVTATMPTTRTALSMTVGPNVQAIINLQIDRTAPNASVGALTLTNMDSFDDPPSAVPPRSFTMLVINATSELAQMTAQVIVPTSAIGQIGYRGIATVPSATYRFVLVSEGWIDYRLEG